MRPARISAANTADPLADEVPGPYDPEPEATDDLWFLPEEVLEAEDWPRSPESGGKRLPLLDPVAWRAAEGNLAADLAALCHDSGRLAERLAMMPGGAGRLSILEAASVSWWVGDRIGADRLALWLILREGAGAEDAPGLARAAWLARRLTASAVKGQGTDALAALFGLSKDDERLGETTVDDLAEAATLLRDMVGLAPATLGCIAFHLWRIAPDDPADGISRTPRARDMAAALLGLRLSAGNGLAFLPMTLAGYGGLTATGPIERRLQAWYASAHQAVLSALMTLERLRLWRQKAEAATADLSGRTPALLIACLADWPTVTAPLAQAVTGASRAAVQRNLDRLVARGLIREITGQGRFRVWAARLG